ncbi:hypothetical protein C0J52_25459, partial [Blattella germanica]
VPIRYIYIDIDRYTSLPTDLSFRIHPPPFSLSPTSGLPPPLHPPPRGTSGASSFYLERSERQNEGVWLFSQGLRSLPTTCFWVWQMDKSSL